MTNDPRTNEQEALRIVKELFPLDGNEPGPVFEARRRALQAIHRTWGFSQGAELDE